MRPSAGDYDPTPATIHSAEYNLNVGEPETQYPSLGTIYIKFKQRDAREIMQQRQTVSQTICYIRTHRCDLADSIRPNQHIVHKGFVYKIVGLNPIPWKDDEIEFICNSVVV